MPSSDELVGCESDDWEEEAVGRELSTRRSNWPFTLLEAEVVGYISGGWISPGAVPAKLSSVNQPQLSHKVSRDDLRLSDPGTGSHTERHNARSSNMQSNLLPMQF